MSLLNLLEDPAQDDPDDPSDDGHHVGDRLQGECSCSNLYESITKRVSIGVASHHRFRVAQKTPSESGPRAPLDQVPPNDPAAISITVSTA